MLRRALLLAVLLAPVAGRGQFIDVVPAGPFSLAECATPTTPLTVYWSMPTGTLVPQAGWFYRILASTTSQCTYVATAPTNVVAGNITPVPLDAAGLVDQRYPKVGTSTTLTLAAFKTASGTTCLNNPIIYTCVQLVKNDADATVAADSGIQELKVETSLPPVPTGVGVSPGSAALLVSWTDGAATGVSPATYEGRARATCLDTVPVPTPCDTAVHQFGTTSPTQSYRLGGLMIGVEYAIEVRAISASGNISAYSAPVNGTPIEVFDFWQLYDGLNGPEEGGCAGGAGGLLSLVAAAGLVRRLRRRS